MKQDNKKIEQHPSFGIIRASRVSGGKGHFFGSEVLNYSFIEITISHAQTNENLFGREVGEQGIWPTDHVATIRMTNNQFAEMITSLNIGIGTPCTITRIDGKEVEQKDIKDSSTAMDRANDELVRMYAERIGNNIESLQNALSLLENNARVNKDIKQSVEKSIRGILSILTNGDNFLLSEFKDVLEKSKQKVMTEIDASVGTRLQELGMQHIFEHKQLTDNNEN